MDREPIEHSPADIAFTEPPVPEPEQPAGSTRDLTEGSIPGHIIALAVPSAVTNLLNTSYHFIDMLWLGRVGPSAIAVTTTFHYFFMVFVFFNQIVGIGSISLIARSFGAKDLAGCRRFIGQTFSFKLVIAILVMIIGLVFQRWAWTAFGSAPDVIEMGIQYSTIMFAVIPIFFSSFTLRTALTAIGDMKTLLRISIVSTLVNLVLDPFMIFETVYIGPFPALGINEPLLTLPGAGMGVAGAAWASFAAILVLFLMGQYYFVTGKTLIRVPVRDLFQWDWQTVWRVLRIGTPPSIGENLNSIAQVFVGKVINIYGTAVFAAHGIVMMLFGVIFIPVGGISQAVTTLVGQNLGAGKPDRAEQSVNQAAVMTIGVLVPLLGVAAIWVEPIVRIFVPGTDSQSIETITWAVIFLRCVLVIIFAMGIGMVYGSCFWGSGDTKPQMWITLATTWGVQLPVVLGGAYIWKLESPLFIPFGLIAASIIGAIATYYVFRLGRWKAVKV